MELISYILTVIGAGTVVCFILLGAMFTVSIVEAKLDTTPAVARRCAWCDPPRFLSKRDRLAHEREGVPISDVACRSCARRLDKEIDELMGT